VAVEEEKTKTKKKKKKGTMCRRRRIRITDKEGAGFFHVVGFHAVTNLCDVDSKVLEKQRRRG
jgi:hypothetical protein